MKRMDSTRVLWVLVVALGGLQAWSLLGTSGETKSGPVAVVQDATGLERRIARLEVELARSVRKDLGAAPARRPVETEDADAELERLRALERRVAALEERAGPRVEQDPERRLALRGLLEAIRNGDLAAATGLLEGVDLNASDESGNTPLLVAASSGNAEMIEALIAHGADLEIRGERGLTPLLAALESDHDGLAELLLDHGSNPQVRDKNGESALIWAAHAGSTTAVSRLIAAGLDVNARSFDGNTAIADAVRKGHGEVIRLLWRSGADVNARNRDGESVLDLARQAGDEEIVRLLVELGAR